jgi:hypothetical protein
VGAAALPPNLGADYLGAVKTCVQCKRLVPDLVTIRPGNGNKKPPQRRCKECAVSYAKLMRERNGSRRTDLA